MFFQNADPTHAAKSFPVCDNCYLELQKGIEFIQNKLDYHISSVQSIQKNEINFWLIPHLNDPQLIMDFKSELGNKNLYLNSLKDLCDFRSGSARYKYLNIYEIEPMQKWLKQKSL